jgi:hypothetical protein
MSAAANLSGMQALVRELRRGREVDLTLLRAVALGGPPVLGLLAGIGCVQLPFLQARVAGPLLEILGQVIWLVLTAGGITLALLWMVARLDWYRRHVGASAEQLGLARLLAADELPEDFARAQARRDWLTTPVAALLGRRVPDAVQRARELVAGYPNWARAHGYRHEPDLQLFALYPFVFVGMSIWLRPYGHYIMGALAIVLLVYMVCEFLARRVAIREVLLSALDPTDTAH